MSLQKIGALWLKTGKKGKFMSGEIEFNGQKIRLMVFRNTKTKDTHPDYQINMQVPDEDQGQAYYSEQGGDNRQAPPTNSHFDDDIPF